MASEFVCVDYLRHLIRQPGNLTKEMNTDSENDFVFIAYRHHSRQT